MSDNSARAVKDTLRRFIAHQLLNGRNGTPIDDGDDLLGSGLVDSVGMASLVLFIEETLKIEVPPEDVVLENFLSIGSIEAYLVRRGAI